MLEAGQEPLPGYRLTRPLGKGGFGEVWEARDSAGRALALKFLEETGKNVPPERLLDWLEQAATALDFLAGVTLPGFNCSSKGLQHCDVKPSNLLLVGDVVKVADFGLCAGTSWQTHRNGWKGTPPFAAPELYRGQAAVGTDQYALAITFLKLCCGDRPFWPEVPGADPRSLPVDL